MNNPKNSIIGINRKILNEPEPKYNLSTNYNRILGKIEIKRRSEQGVKLYNVNKQNIQIKMIGKIVPDDKLHYCNEKSGAKKICYNLNREIRRLDAQVILLIKDMSPI